MSSFFSFCGSPNPSVRGGTSRDKDADSPIGAVSTKDDNTQCSAVSVSVVSNSSKSMLSSRAEKGEFLPTCKQSHHENLSRQCIRPRVLAKLIEESASYHNNIEHIEALFGDAEMLPEDSRVFSTSGTPNPPKMQRFHSSSETKLRAPLLINKRQSGRPSTNFSLFGDKEGEIFPD